MDNCKLFVLLVDWANNQYVLFGIGLQYANGDKMLLLGKNNRKTGTKGGKKIIPIIFYV